MTRFFGNSGFYAISMLVGPLLFSSCVASNLATQAETPSQSPAALQSVEAAPLEPKPNEPETQAASSYVRRIHPGRMRVSLDEETNALKVEIRLDQCQPGGFVYEKNSLDIQVDHSDRSVTLTGQIEYVERGVSDDATCALNPEPVVVVSENAQRAPYVIKNLSAWKGRGGNGIQARVMDFRTPEQIAADARDCLAQNETEIGNISGIMFLQSDPARASSVFANESMMSFDEVVRTWVGSSVPAFIDTDAPYALSRSPFGNIKFQSANCAIVYDPLTGEPADFVIRQTPDDL